METGTFLKIQRVDIKTVGSSEYFLLMGISVQPENDFANGRRTGDHE
jgi:hypothetical protein